MIVVGGLEILDTRYRVLIVISKNIQGGAKWESAVNSCIADKYTGGF